jgi:hypothetical protein
MPISPNDASAISKAFSQNYNPQSASVDDHYSVQADQNEDGTHNEILFSVRRVSRKQYSAIHQAIAPILNKYFFEVVAGQQGFTFHFSSLKPVEL